jgi:nucleotide-binding universal stress UspA family protein
MTIMEGVVDETGVRLESKLQIFKKILLAIDLSGYNDRIIDYGVRLAKTLGSFVYVVHVIEESPRNPKVDVMQYYAEGKAYEQDYETDIKKRARTLLEQAKLSGEKEGINMKIDIITNTKVPEAIIEFAKVNDIDLILVGTKDMTGLRFLLGSVSSKVITHALCPVLAIR